MSSGVFMRKNLATLLVLILLGSLSPHLVAQQVIIPAHAPWFNVDLSSGRIDYDPIQTTWLTFAGAGTHVLLPDRDIYSPGAQGNVSSCFMPNSRAKAMSVWVPWRATRWRA